MFWQPLVKQRVTWGRGGMREEKHFCWGIVWSAKRWQSQARREKPHVSDIGFPITYWQLFPIIRLICCPPEWRHLEPWGSAFGSRGAARCRHHCRHSTQSGWWSSTIPNDYCVIHSNKESNKWNWLIKATSALVSTELKWWIPLSLSFCSSCLWKKSKTPTLFI